MAKDPISGAKPGRLMASWSKRENDLFFRFPSSPDGSMLHCYISHVPWHRHNVHGQIIEEGKTLRQELEARGYDITTLRIQVDKKR